MRATTTRRAQRGTVAEEPRLSARRREVVRSKRRRRLWIAGTIVAVVLVAIGGWTLLHRSWFSAKTINVTGAGHETSAAVIEAAGLAGHPPLVSIDTGAVAAGVEQLAWVKRAVVTLRWPSTVDISVTDRTPTGAVQVGSSWLLVDGTGRILQRMATKPFNQVVLQIPKLAATTPGMSLGAAAQPAVTVAGTLPPAFRAQVVLVTGNEDGTITLHLTSPVLVELGPATELTAKYQDIASVIAGTTLHPGDVLDVSVPQASTITGP